MSSHPLFRIGMAAIAATTGFALTGAALVGTAAPALAAPARATTTSPDPTDAGYGAGYLARQLAANGGYVESYGSVDLSSTAYAVLALHAAGVGADQSAAAIGYLEANSGTALDYADGTGNPGLLGDVIMAAVASGQNPAAFGGTTPADDLTARLLATVQTSGKDKGLFGDGDPTYDGAFRQGIALAALHAAGVKAKTVGSSIAWLTRQQCKDGLWESYRSNTHQACPAADPDTFVGPDTNSTGLAAQGLAAFGRHPKKAALVASLEAVRSSDGGFPYLAAAGQSSDPDSTALSIQALLAEGADPGAAYAALETYQLGCSAPTADRGAYFYPGSSDPNTVATVQAVVAAAGATLPLKASTPSSAVPAPTCASTSHPASYASSHAASYSSVIAKKKPVAGKAGACKGTKGVTVTVDFTAFSGGVEQTRCASGSQSSGITAMQDAGFTPAGTTQYGLAFVCRIDDLPSAAQQSCASTPPANAYWAFYVAAAGATTWSYSGSGASTYQPPAGSIEAWAFGDSAMPSLTPAQVRKAKS